MQATGKKNRQCSAHCRFLDLIGVVNLTLAKYPIHINLGNLHRVQGCTFAQVV